MNQRKTGLHKPFIFIDALSVAYIRADHNI